VIEQPSCFASRVLAPVVDKNPRHDVPWIPGGTPTGENLFAFSTFA
jgi:hypothetical protein